ncbi:MAG: Mrp/NBP35 family ATP-binding protein [Anaerolineaceae bacterium]|jgi:Mrp family chromosome partitioning ATPase
MPTEKEIIAALSQVRDPELGRNLVELGMIHDLEIGKNGKVSFTVALTVPGCPLRDKIDTDARQAVLALKGVKEVTINFRSMTPQERQAAMGGMQPSLPKINQFNHVKHVLAIMSGKGGVGKSSITAMLASALTRRNFKVGVLDADVTGPSIPKLFGMPAGVLRSSEQGILPAVTRTGIKMISTNLLLPEEDSAIIWRGPMVSGAIKQFWTDVLWGNLDYLLVDLPPGTSDAALTVMTTMPINSVLLVTTPQQLSAMIVRKALNMLNQVHKPISGVVENMSYYVCPDTDKSHYIFGPSHAEEIAQAAGVAVQAQIPLDPNIALMCDAGQVEDVHMPEIEALVDQIIVPAPAKA